jgi:GAF domain-containing protein
MNNIPTMPIANTLDYQNQRENFIAVVLRLACVLGFVVILFSLPTASVANRILFIGLYAALLSITLLKTKYSVRAFTLLFILFVIGANNVLAWGPWLDGSVFFIALIVLGSLLFDQRVDIFALALSIFTIAAIAVLQQFGVYQLRLSYASATTWLDWLGYTINFSIISAILIVALGHLKRAFVDTTQDMQNTVQALANERAQLESRVFERTEELASRAAQLRSSASISRTIAEMQDVSKLVEKATNLTSEYFGYYHVGLYLLDENKRTAFLQAASSDHAKQLIGQSFRIEPDRLNLAYRVIEHNRPYIASDVDKANFIRDANFPLTRSRMALPLTVRNNVIGILDMHSDQPEAFNDQDAEVLQTLADLVSISLDNARLINETKNLLQQLELNTSTKTRETWTKFTSRHKPAYQYTPAGVRPIFATNKQDDRDGLQVPLVLHGQHIGNITLKRKGASVTWSERERILVEKVADQVALAIENSRLVDETQKSALRDQMIANISARIRETLDVESVLRTAAAELRRVFDLKEAEVTIGSLQAESTSARKATGSLRVR